MNIGRLIYNLSNLGYETNLSGDTIVIYKDGDVIALVNEDGSIYDNNFYLLTEDERMELVNIIRIAYEDEKRPVVENKPLTLKIKDVSLPSEKLVLLYFQFLNLFDIHSVTPETISKDLGYTEEIIDQIVRNLVDKNLIQHIKINGEINFKVI